MNPGDPTLKCHLFSHSPLPPSEPGLQQDDAHDHGGKVRKTRNRPLQNAKQPYDNRRLLMGKVSSSRLTEMLAEAAPERNPTRCHPTPLTEQTPASVQTHAEPRGVYCSSTGLQPRSPAALPNPAPTLPPRVQLQTQAFGGRTTPQAGKPIPPPPSPTPPAEIPHLRAPPPGTGADPLG